MPCFGGNDAGLDVRAHHDLHGMSHGGDRVLVLVLIPAGLDDSAADTRQGSHDCCGHRLRLLVEAGARLDAIGGLGK